MKLSNKLILGLTVSSLAGKFLEKMLIKDNVSPNTVTSFNEDSDIPNIDASSYIHHFASVIGSVTIGRNVLIGPFSSIRGDTGLKIFIGHDCNIQDGVVMHGLKNYEYHNPITEHSVFKDREAYSIYIGEKVSLAPQCQIHGPARIDGNVFVGMQSLVFDAYVQEDAVIEPGAKVIGVTIPPKRYIPAGQVIANQEDANQLPEITDAYPYHDLNAKITAANLELAKSYKKEERQWKQ
ncbi:carbonic anhydrase [Bacillus swezeyi]|uniref:Carbonic anhydrase n=1 Tax=Bacillus swezeyi TaxID=1925020 RepID=A0A1R1QFI0_9BACI|nr:carbonic anhydrase [Bacillus swezeyi]MEC1260275.1 carbonic anhydrase [Bacillus swezeyi]MED2929882.1 carbonic anhydrase [Bacillus swezeyi]MED2942804.1 carbonic anhydrase [Bacillus swezeyi]MED2964704.1 carbonic anhydrase [Bacillus swezeyi]MED3073015.1 carbonic anhydrase [Bacillus swezeyi]